MVDSAAGCKSEEVLIEVPWGNIAGKWWGSREVQPVIAIHGWQDNCGSFEKLAPLLVEANIALLCIDLPGHGCSSHYPQGTFYYLFWDGIYVLRRMVKKFNWKRIQILGHSLGGAVAFLYSSIYPDEVECYISLDIASPAVRNVNSLTEKLGNAVDAYLKYENYKPTEVKTYDYDEIIDIALKAYNGSCTRESCEILMKRGTKEDNNGRFYVTRDIRLKVAGLAMIDVNQAMHMAQKIRCRVLNIKATPGMNWENPEYYDMVLDELEKFSTVLERHTVEGTHHLHLNDPKSVSDIIIKFLKIS